MQAWLEQRGMPRGALLTMDQCWRLADAWHGDRLDPAWSRRATHEAQALFDSIGLRGAFWRL